MIELPILTIRMEVPRVTSEVHMFVAAEVDKLKDQIADQIKSATLERLDKIETVIGAEADRAIQQIISRNVNEITFEIMNTPEMHERISTMIRSAIESALAGKETK